MYTAESNGAMVLFFLVGILSSKVFDVCTWFSTGKKLAESIVREKLAACVNRVPGMIFSSFYILFSVVCGLLLIWLICVWIWSSFEKIGLNWKLRIFLSKSRLNFSFSPLHCVWCRCGVSVWMEGRGMSFIFHADFIWIW